MVGLLDLCLPELLFGPSGLRGRCHDKTGEKSRRGVQTQAITYHAGADFPMSLVSVPPRAASYPKGWRRSGGHADKGCLGHRPRRRQSVSEPNVTAALETAFHMRSALWTHTYSHPLPAVQAQELPPSRLRRLCLDGEVRLLDQDLFDPFIAAFEAPLMVLWRLLSSMGSFRRTCLQRAGEVVRKAALKAGPSLRGAPKAGRGMRGAKFLVEGSGWGALSTCTPCMEPSSVSIWVREAIRVREDLTNTQGFWLYLLRNTARVSSTVSWRQTLCGTGSGCASPLC